MKIVGMGFTYGLPGIPQGRIILNMSNGGERFNFDISFNQGPRHVLVRTNRNTLQSQAVHAVGQIANKTVPIVLDLKWRIDQDATVKGSFIANISRLLTDRGVFDAFSQQFIEKFEEYFQREQICVL